GATACPAATGPAAASSAGPLDDHDAGAAARLGGQLELVDQPPRAGQTEAEADTRTPAVGQGQVDVRDARALVGEADPDAALAERRRDHLDPGQAAAAVYQGVAGQLAGCRHHLGLVHQGQASLGRYHPHLLPNADDVVSGPDRQLIHQARPFSSSRPFSAFSAVRTPRRDRPSSVSVIATAGRMPTRTVSASNSREIDPIMASIRPMKESTISTAVMSMITPRAPVAASSSASFLEPHDALVLQVDLDGDEERRPDLEDRHAVHQAGPGFWGSVRCWPGRCWPMRWPRRFSTCASASASVALVAMSPNSMPSDTIVCATCGRMPL